MTGRYKWGNKTDTRKTANYRRLSGIELPWTLREGLSLDIKRLSWINNSQVSEQEERILKSSKLAECPVAFMWEKILDMTGLDDGCPVICIYYTPACSCFEYTCKNAERLTGFCCPRCSHLSTILNNNIVEPESGVTILFTIVDNRQFPL